MKLYIISPNYELVGLEDWSMTENPKSANFILIEEEDGSRFMLYKKIIDNSTFKEAEKLASELSVDIFDNFTLGSFEQWLNICKDNKFYELINEALKLIGGDPVYGNNWTSKILDENTGVSFNCVESQYSIENVSILEKASARAFYTCKIVCYI